MKFNARWQSRIKSRPLVSTTLAFFLVIGVWSQLTPLFAAPDEPASYIRGAALVRGQFIGTDLVSSVTTGYWSTYVDIPQQFGVAQLVPWCFVGKPDTPACSLPLETLTPVEQPRTDMGRYPPTGYLFSGVGSLIGPTDNSVALGRLINSGVCALLLALACICYGRVGRSPLLVLAAITPGVIFASSVISASAIEISAAICLWASFSTWIKSVSKLNSFALTASGVLLTLARPTGPIYLVVTLVIVLLASPLNSNLMTLVSRGWGLILVTGSATLFAASWQFRIYSHNLKVSYVKSDSSLTLLKITEQSLNDLSRKIAESIGNFGWLDTPAPTIVVWSFIFFAVAPTLRSWKIMEMRNKFALIFLPLIIFLMMIYLNWNTQRYGGNFGVQGRHLTPLIVGFPIVGGLLWKPSVSTIRLFLPAWSLSIFISGAIALRRYSVGVKQFNFFEMFSNPVWHPPLGVLGTMLALAVALTIFSSIFYTIATSDLENSR